MVTERLPSVRSVALGFWIGVGSAGEHDSEAGISHLLEHMLFRGTERYGSEEIDQIFDAMGAEINAGTDKESTSLYSRVIDRHLDDAFDVMADMVWRPRFGELETEREVVLEEIAMYEDDPQDRVFDVLGRAIFGSHPLGRPVIGTREVISGRHARAAGRLPPHPLRPSQHRDRGGRLGRARRARGDRSRSSEQARAGGVAPGVRPVGRDARGIGPSWELAPAQLQRRVRFLAKDTEQYHVCLGGPGLARDDERRFALRVLEGVLGGTSSSRLFQEVRERRGLAYSVFCFSNLYASTGEVGIYVGTRPDNLRSALEVLATELARCVEDPASEQELVRSRENLKGRMVLALESTGARMSRLGASLLNGLPILSVEEIIERIDAVGVEQLRELAGELFALERLSVAGVGPDEDSFNDAIEPLGGLVAAGAVGEAALAPGADGAP